MAKLTKFAIFTRAFLLALLAASPARVGGQSSDEEALWQRALEANNVEGYHAYLSIHPDGAYVLEAVDALRRLGAFSGSSNGVSGTRSLNNGVY